MGVVKRCIFVLSLINTISPLLAIPAASSALKVLTPLEQAPHPNHQPHQPPQQSAQEQKAPHSSSFLQSSSPYKDPEFEHFVNHDKVVLFILDGFGSYQLERGDRGGVDLPVWDMLWNNGAHTYEARCSMPTISEPNIASILAGASPASHGVVGNCDYKGDLYETLMTPITGGDYFSFPSIMKVIKENAPDADIAAISWWPCFHKLLNDRYVEFKWSVSSALKNPYNATGMVETMTNNYFNKSGTIQIPKLAIFHFEDADDAGHMDGWGSEDYWSNAVIMDKAIGQVLDIYKKGNALDRTLVIVTADHGGGPDNMHGGVADILDTYDARVPIIFYGPDVKQGYNIPCPDVDKDCYDKYAPSMFNYDVAPSIALWLGYDRPPAWTGRPIFKAFQV